MSYLFNSNTDVIDAGSAIEIGVDSGLLTFWLYPTWAQSDGVEHPLIDVRNAGANNYFTINKFSDNKLYAGWLTSGAEYRVSVASGSYTLNQNAWNCIQCLWNINTPETRLRLNGTEIGAVTSGLSVWSTSGRNFTIGAISGVLTVNAAGKIAEVSLFRYAGSAVDSNHVAALAAGVSPLLIGRTNQTYYWPLVANGAQVIAFGTPTPATLTNVTVDAHPRVYAPASRPQRTGVYAAPPSSPRVVGGPRVILPPQPTMLF